MTPAKKNLLGLAALLYLAAALTTLFGSGITPLGKQKLDVLLIEESADRTKLPAAQRAVLTSGTFRKWLTEHGHAFVGLVDVNGLKDRTGQPPAAMVPYLNSFAAAKIPLPAVVLRYSGREKYAAFPLPADEAAMIKLLQSQGG